MKKLFTSVLMLLSLSIYAEDSGRLSCEIDAGSWKQAANQGMRYYREISKEDCIKLGEDLFNSPATVGWSHMNPIKNTKTEYKYETQYLKVKATHYSEDGIKYTKIFKRKDVYKKLVSKTISELENGFKCWTQGECRVLSVLDVTEQN